MSSLHPISPNAPIQLLLSAYKESESQGKQLQCTNNP